MTYKARRLFTLRFPHLGVAIAVPIAVGIPYRVRVQPCVVIVAVFLIVHIACGLKAVVKRFVWVSIAVAITVLIKMARRNIDNVGGGVIIIIRLPHLIPWWSAPYKVSRSSIAVVVIIGIPLGIGV